MGKPPNAHWDLRILQPVLALIRALYQTLEVHIVKAASTRDTISKGGYGTDAENMESRVPTVTGTAKEICFIRTQFINTRPI